MADVSITAILVNATPSDVANARTAILAARSALIANGVTNITINVSIQGVS